MAFHPFEEMTPVLPEGNMRTQPVHIGAWESLEGIFFF